MPSKTRSLGGCITCRRRHAKCDQGKPICSTCKSAEIVCEGYTQGLRWVTTAEAAGNGVPASFGARRPLYTEASRKMMATALTISVPWSSVDVTIANIDAESRKKSSCSACEVSTGPFGVFSLKTPGTSTLSWFSVPTEKSTSCRPAEQFQIAHDLDNIVFSYSSLGKLPGVEEYVNDEADCLGWTDLFNLDFEILDLQQQISTAPSPERRQSELEHAVQPQLHLENLLFIDRSDSTIVTDLAELSTQPASRTVGSVDLHSPDIHILLKHFSHNVIANMASIPNTGESPWGTLNHATAVYTLAEATYLEHSKVKLANLANLHAILAISAYHLGSGTVETGNSREYWMGFSSTAARQAKAYLQQSLEVEICGPNPAKYKDQLMALQAIMAYSWISGNDRETRHYVIECEYLMRNRGLVKNETSERTRLLHHIYTWSRIIGETTYVLHDYGGFVNTLISGPRPFPSQGERNATENTSPQACESQTRFDDFLSISLLIVGEESNQESFKDPYAGSHDIHLEDPRAYLEDVYLMIYGVPKKWLSLVSQTTRLANLMDTAELAEDSTISGMLKSLSDRANRLENAVCAFVDSNRQKEQRMAIQASHEQVKTIKTPGEYMFQCLNSALLIFFYRRIRNCNSLILQTYVDDIIQGLEDFDVSLSQHDIPGPGVPWAAFMAGCEAMTASRRESLGGWMHRAYKKCGFQCYREANVVMKEVWRQKDKGVTASPRSEVVATGSTWMDILRQKKSCLFLF